MSIATMAPPLTAADEVDSALVQRGFAVIDTTQLRTLLDVMPGVAEHSRWRRRAEGFAQRARA